MKSGHVISDHNTTFHDHPPNSVCNILSGVNRGGQGVNIIVRHKFLRFVGNFNPLPYQLSTKSKMVLNVGNFLSLPPDPEFLVTPLNILMQIAN